MSKRNCKIIASGITGKGVLEKPSGITPAACGDCKKDMEGWLKDREIPTTRDARRAFALGAEKQAQDFGDWLGNTNLIDRVKKAEAKIKAAETATFVPNEKKQEPAKFTVKVDKRRADLAARMFASKIYPIYAFASIAWSGGETDEVLTIGEIYELLLDLYDDLTTDPNSYSVGEGCFYCEWIDDGDIAQFGFTLSLSLPSQEA